jgi:hypothetical protein
MSASIPSIHRDADNCLNKCVLEVGGKLLTTETPGN